MSREEYQMPTGGGGGGASQNQAPTTTTTVSAPTAPPILYTCGDCGYKRDLKRNEPVRCVICGGRVLYKDRTSRMIEFEAR